MCCTTGPPLPYRQHLVTASPALAQSYSPASRSQDVTPNSRPIAVHLPQTLRLSLCALSSPSLSSLPSPLLSLLRVPVSISILRNTIHTFLLSFHSLLHSVTHSFTHLLRCICALNRSAARDKNSKTITSPRSTQLDPHLASVTLTKVAFHDSLLDHPHSPTLRSSTTFSETASPSSAGQTSDKNSIQVTDNDNSYNHSLST